MARVQQRADTHQTVTSPEHPNIVSAPSCPNFSNPVNCSSIKLPATAIADLSSAISPVADGSWSGTLRTPGKKYVLQLAAYAARKAMIYCGLAKGLDGMWSVDQLSEEMRTIIATHPRHFEGEPVQTGSSSEPAQETHKTYASTTVVRKHQTPVTRTSKPRSHTILKHTDTNKQTTTLTSTHASVTSPPTSTLWYHAAHDSCRRSAILAQAATRGIAHTNTQASTRIPIDSYVTPIASSSLTPAVCSRWRLATASLSLTLSPPLSRLSLVHRASPRAPRPRALTRFSPSLPLGFSALVLRSVGLYSSRRILDCRARRRPRVQSL